GASQRVARARLVQLAQQALLARVREREAKRHARAELNPVIVADLRAGDALALEKRAVARAQVLDEVLTILDHEARVEAADTVVVDRQLIGRVPAHRERTLRDAQYLACAHAVHTQQHRAVAHQRLLGRGTDAKVRAAQRDVERAL